MKALRPLLACAVLAAPAYAQNLAPENSERDPLLSALEEITDEEGPSVTVDIRSTAESHVPDEEKKPVEVKGELQEDETPAPEEAPPAPPEPEGVTVSVEPGSSGSGSVDAKSVKLLAPFPAKPLAAPPTGWRLEHPKDLPAFTREVPLSNGTRIQLSIRPHLLVPDADGAQVISVSEPGFEPDKRYAQTATTAAVLATSLERLDDDSRKMGEAIDRLEQLLGSLPAPVAPPVATPVAPTPNKKQR
ncbi:hypothetical protein OJ996_16130 [Luteolibacter sp. GHJ8]|uniref:Uncharacterized protein n=1 Tax=Luteolibacter rhizosphaerae TaxID=2989719 RepID=A0ABT3G5J6_9BACT|nr:hypothetical protein [Luteolibacter rhizosphaerae]MCW1915115.1 hypothetical protein [Luteolibacter rhizosphaerae]